MSNNASISKKEIKETLQLTTYKTKQQINFLKQAGRIAYVGSSKNGHWVILPQNSNNTP